MKTVVGLFDTMDEANRAALDLEYAGITHNDISVVVNNTNRQFAMKTDGRPEGSTNHAIEHDAIVGAEIGGVAGLLIGLTSLALPGVGWAAGVGWFWMMVTGAAFGAIAGGLVGGLTRLGVTPEEAASYTEGVRRGGILVVVRARDEMADRVSRSLSNHGAINIDERAEQYRREGFTPTPTDADATTPFMSQPITTEATRAASSPATMRESTYGEHISRSTGYEVIERTSAPWDMPKEADDAVIGDRIDDRTGKTVR